MEKSLTIHDIVHHYLFNRCSSVVPKSPFKELGTMMNEMNLIKNQYKKAISTTSLVVRKSNIEIFLKMCVRSYAKGHQWCLSIASTDIAADKLLNDSFTDRNGKVCKLFKNDFQLNEIFEDFEQLYSAVKQLIGSVTSIKNVTIYDTARRLGHCYKTPIYPQQFIYLPAENVHWASEYLLQQKLEFIEPIEKFMNVFGTLPPIIIEDILCIYSDYFYGHIKRKHCSLACNYIKDDTYGKPWWRNKTKDFVAQQDYLIEQSKKKGIVVWPVFKPLLK